MARLVQPQTSEMDAASRGAATDGSLNSRPRRFPASGVPTTGCRIPRPLRAIPGRGHGARLRHRGVLLQRSLATRQGLRVDLLARLLEIGEFGKYMAEVSQAAQALTHASASDVVLGSSVAARRRTRRVGRRPGSRPSSDAAARRLQRGRSVLSEAAGRVSMWVPVRHSGRMLGRLRLEWPARPSPKSIEQLRDYLAHAGAALARILAEERLARQHRRYEALLDSLPDACLLILAADCSVIGVRGRLQASAGLDTSRLLGAPLVAGDGRHGLVRLPRPGLRRLVAQARAQGRAEIETWLQGSNREIEVLMTLVDLRQRGEMVCVLRDLTAVKAMELALVHRNEELTRAAERLREIDLLKNEFMSNVSHELRTPLTAIIAYSEALLLAPPGPTTQRDFLQVIADQGHKLQRLIAGLLDIATIESLATELKLEQASLNQVVRSAIVTVQPLADKNRITLEATLQPDIPLVWLDELRAQQIVWNLLTNAIKFSPPGTTVRVRTWNDNTNVWTAVRDEGPGIAPEHQRLIFEKFVQLDGSTTRRHGGVGLGLDLVKHLVDLHGGEVGVESEPENGSTFTFSIPLEKRRKPRLDEVRSPAVASRSAS
jgi:signal transduction histidine kinase